jgi:hypothetical protein
MVDKRIQSDETACMRPLTSQIEWFAARSVRLPRQTGGGPEAETGATGNLVGTNILSFAGVVSLPALTMIINRPIRQASRFNMEWQK